MISIYFKQSDDVLIIYYKYWDGFTVEWIIGVAFGFLSIMVVLLIIILVYYVCLCERCYLCCCCYLCRSFKRRKCCSSKKQIEIHQQRKILTKRGLIKTNSSSIKNNLVLLCMPHNIINHQKMILLINLGSTIATIMIMLLCLIHTFILK